MAITITSGLPANAHIESVSPHEVKLMDKTIDNRFLDKIHDQLIGDKAYDSDPLDQRLKEDKDIELIVPHKQNRKNPKQRMGANSGAKSDVGKLNVFLLG